MFAVEAGILQLTQWLLTPVLLLLALGFVFALWMCGVVAAEGWQRKRVPLVHDEPALTLEELELKVLGRLEVLRLLSRVTPLLGLIATMIPLGPALQAVANGQGNAALAVFSNAFAGVVLALATAAVGLVLYSIRRRWLLAELVQIRKQRQVAA